MFLNMSTDFTFYVYVVLAIILGVVIIKKVASCLLKTIGLLLLAAIGAALYLLFFQ